MVCLSVCKMHCLCMCVCVCVCVCVCERERESAKESQSGLSVLSAKQTTGPGGENSTKDHTTDD